MGIHLAAQLEGVTVVNLHGTPMLDDVSLTVLGGEALAVCGPTGSGKTTILRLLAGLITPTQGRVLVDGRPVESLSYEEMRAWRRRLGLALEGGFWTNRSVLDNIALPLRYHEPERRDVATRVEEVAEEVGLTEALTQSGPQATRSVRKLALLARALVHEPEIFLCDEPQHGLLPREARRASEAIERRRRERGMTVVYADHDGRLRPFVCERRMFFEGGRPVDRPSVVISRRDLDDLDLGLPRDSLLGEPASEMP